MRALVISGVTLVLLVGAAPLAVPGVPLRLHGVPTPVALATLGLAVIAAVGGLLLLRRGRRPRHPAHAAGVPGPGPAPAPRPAPPAASPAAPGFVAVRLRR